MKCLASESKPNAPHVPHVEPACGLDNDGPFWSGKFQNTITEPQQATFYKLN